MTDLGMEQIIIALIGTFGTVLSALLIFFTRQLRRGHAMSQEERDTLTRIEVKLETIERGLGQERERRHELTRRLDEHLVRHP